MWNNSEIKASLNLVVKGVFEADALVTDSRSIKPGEIFLALSGENFDGNDFVDQAVENGAVAVIVSRKSEHISVPQILVDDTYEALISLAEYRRNIVSAKYIAITGSVGKTSFKEALKLVLSNYGKTYATIGNYNNHIGLPLCLVNMPADTKYAIFELGMNHAGEIKFLSDLLKPNLAFITKIADAHIGNFKNASDIAKAKAEICSGLDENGVVILNNSDSNFSQLKSYIKTDYSIGDDSIKSFGINEGDIEVKEINYKGGVAVASVKSLKEEFTVEFSIHNFALIELLTGVFSILDILDLPFSKARKPLLDFKPVEGRGNLVETKIAQKSLSIINDAYNANYDSMKEAINTLGRIAGRKGLRKVAIIGDMLELGDKSEQYHLMLKEPLLENKIDKVVTIGRFMESLYRSLPENMRLFHFNEVPKNIEQIIDKVEDGDVILVKSSKGTGTNRIIKKIEELSNVL